MFKILLIEDNIDFRQAFEDALIDNLHVSVYGVENCTSGLKFVSSQLPNLAFIDINLPDGNGLDLAKTIKELHPDIYIIILSLVDSPEYVTAALDSGADHFISKSAMNINEVVSLIEPMMTINKKRYLF